MFHDFISPSPRTFDVSGKSDGAPAERLEAWPFRLLQRRWVLVLANPVGSRIRDNELTGGNYQSFFITLDFLLIDRPKSRRPREFGMGGFQCRDRMKAAGTSRALFPEHAHIQ